MSSPHAPTSLYANIKSEPPIERPQRARRSMETARIPREDCLRNSYSMEDFKAHAARVVRQTAKKMKFEMQELVLRLIEKQEGVWDSGVRFGLDKCHLVAYSLYRRTGEYVTGHQVRSIYLTAKTNLKERLLTCIRDKLDAQQTEAKLSEWPLYPSFRYYRQTMTQWEEKERRARCGDDDVIYAGETSMDSSTMSIGERTNPLESVKQEPGAESTSDEVDGYLYGTLNTSASDFGKSRMIFNTTHPQLSMPSPTPQPSTSISQPSTPIHSSDNSNFHFITDRLNALSEEPAKKKLAMNAIVKVLLQVEESAATTTRQLFEELAR